MKRVLYGAVIAAMTAVTPALAFAQSYPAVDQGQPSASAHGPSDIMASVQPRAIVRTSPEYWRTGSFAAVDEGQPSASQHGPSIALPIIYPADQAQVSASAHGPSYAGELSTERSH